MNIAQHQYDWQKFMLITVKSSALIDIDGLLKDIFAQQKMKDIFAFGAKICSLFQMQYAWENGVVEVIRIELTAF